MTNGGSASAMFQSTLPVKGVTRSQWMIPASEIVSIHTPSEGSDVQQGECLFLGDVSIHTPSEGSDTPIKSFV